MIKELSIGLYLVCFRIYFSLCQLFPLQNKTTFVASFEDNILYTMREVEKETEDHIVILRTTKHKVRIPPSARRIVLEFSIPHLLDWFVAVYHLATSRVIFVDNYYGFLSAAPFRRDVVCIQ